MTASKKFTRRDLFTIIGFLIIYCFGLVVPPFGGITPLGIKMLGVLIGLIFMTCVGCDIITSSLMALIAFVVHGYYTNAEMVATWVGSTTTFQLVFCGALCLAMRETGAMDVLAKKMLTSKAAKSSPAMLILMLMLAGLMVSIFISGAPFFLLFFGLIESILLVAGYDRKDPIFPLLLLGVYVSGYGMFILPWKGAMAVTLGFFNTVLEPYGLRFNEFLYMFLQIFTWVGFDVIYILALKYIFKADFHKLKKVDAANLEAFQKVPDKFDFHMKVTIYSLLFCVAYVLLCYLLPRTTPGYKVWGSFGAVLIWVLPLTLFSILRKDGKPILNVAALAQKSSFWTMIALVGSLTMLGKIATDNELGIRGWLVGIFTPIFGNMPMWLFLLVIVVFTTVVTQVVNGQVLTMGLTPVVAPVMMEMIQGGAKGNPTVALGVLSAAATVAFLTVSGSVNAAYLINREEISQKFLFTKGVAVLALYMVWQYLVAVAFNYLFPVVL